METFDVVIVGYGPVGRMLALKLGRRGRRVLVLERQAATYPLPRAVHHDDEIGRVLQGIGLPPSSIPDVTEPYDDFYEWRNAEHKTLVRLDWRGTGPSGWNVSNFFHQPSLEHKIHELVLQTPTVDLRWGHQVAGHTIVDDGVILDIDDASGASYQVTGRYVVGADGANSFVRGWIGEQFSDLGYYRDWLVVDVLPAEALPISPPAWQLCDPNRPTTLVPAGPGRRRWEFMRLPHEENAEFASVENAWELMRPWGVTPANATLERHALYTFQARWVEHWRKGRLLLAGDAAHLMPPFAGQGMCSGVRDAINLEWKLDLVLSGADEALLDTYGTERAGHVRSFIEFSMELGAVICIDDPQAAADRDLAMMADLAAGLSPPPRPLPHLGPGLQQAAPAGDSVSSLVGTLSIQAVVESAGGAALLDDAVGSPGALIGTSEVMSSLDDRHRKALASVGIATVVLTDSAVGDGVVDTTGAYTSWLSEAGVSAALVRPDFYVFGTASKSGELNQLVEDFLARVTTAA